MRLSTFVIGVLVGTIFSSFAAFAWTGAPASPPNSNVSAPINIGSTAQEKDGGFYVSDLLESDTLAVYGNAILGGSNRYLNWGATSGDSGYGIRDNAGTLEFKNNGGSWASLQSTVFSLVGTSGIKNIQSFTASGTYTPTSGATKVVAICVGGGAGGTPVSGAWGGGGGAGELAIGFFDAAVTSVVIGAGGGSAASGGTTSFGSMTAVGGSASAEGGEGGWGGTGGSFHSGGGNGTYGTGWACGGGGASFFGGGSCKIGAPPTPRAYGAGGGGSASNYGYSGGSGASGACLLLEF